MTNCSEVAPREGANWDELYDCEPLPLSLILLLFLVAAWGFFLIVVLIRGLKHYCSATTDMVVAKKMQQVQMWFYSFFYTGVYASSLFAVVSLFSDGMIVSGIFLLLAIVGSQLVASTIDVVGTDKKKPGVNDFDLKITLQHMFTVYLPKAVWKMSGHREFEKEGEEVKKSTSMSAVVSKLCCLETIDNTITPKVYDVKDVTGIQGVFLGLPALTILLMTFIRSFEDSEAFANSTTLEAAAEAVYDFNPLLKTAAVMTLISTLAPPILGDWETFSHDYNLNAKKTAGYSVLSLGKRTLELTGKLGMYVYLLDASKFSGFILFGLETFAMYATYLSKYDSPTAGRTHVLSHYVISSVEAVFFGFYRRISVDKEFTTQSSMQSPTIELIRYGIKGVGTFIGYMWILIANVPEIYVNPSVLRGSVAEASGELLSSLFLVGIASNALLVPLLTVEFLVFRRSELDKNERKKLINYWKTWAFCRNVCCCPTVRHLERSRPMGGLEENGPIGYH